MNNESTKPNDASQPTMTNSEHNLLTDLMSTNRALTPDEVAECDRLFGLWDKHDLYIQIHGELHQRNFSRKARKDVCFSIGCIF